MKIMIAVLGLLNINISYSQDWQLSQTGLCIQKPTGCPTRVQRYGVCCKLNGQARQFNNYCQACAMGCEQWKYKLSLQDRCR